MPHINFALDYTVGVYCVNKNKILLVHHRNMGMWLPPGGHIEPGEVPDVAARREFIEEVGLDVRLVGNKLNFNSPDVESLCQPAFMDVHIVPKFPHHRHVGMAYFGILPNPEQDTPSLCAEEHIAVGWFSKEDVEKLEPMNVANRHYALEALRVLETK